MTSDTADDRFRLQLRSRMREAGDARRAKQQQAYMRSALPYFGVRTPEVRRLTRSVAGVFPFTSAEAWEATILSLWRQAERREERTAAVELLLHPGYRNWLTPARMPLVEELVVTGAWWDFVDAIASVGMAAMLADHPDEMPSILRLWAHDNDMWKRRTAILSQLRSRQQTDPQLLFDVIEPSIGRDEFFLRKAIGWALRTYSRTAPEVVVDYVNANAHRMSGLSRREALKTLLRTKTVTSVP